MQLFSFNNPFKAGDKVTITDSQGVTFTTLVMSMTVNKNGATLTSTGNEVYANASSSLDSTILALTESAKMNQYFWFKSSEQEAGAHITKIPKEKFLENPEDKNILISIDGLKIRDGLDILAIFDKDRIRLGQIKDNQFLWNISSDGFDLSYIRERTDSGYTYFEDTSFFYIGSLGESSNSYQSTEQYSNATLASSNSAYIIVDLPERVIPVESSLKFVEEGYSINVTVRDGPTLEVDTYMRTIEAFLAENLLDAADVEWIIETAQANNYTYMGREIWDSDIYSLDDDHNILSKAPSEKQYVFFTAINAARYSYRYYPLKITTNHFKDYSEILGFSFTLLYPDADHSNYRVNFGEISGNNLHRFGWEIVNGELQKSIYNLGDYIKYNAVPPLTCFLGTHNGNKIGMFSAGIGENTNPKGADSLAIGLGTETSDYSVAIGKYNNNQNVNVFEIGNGESDSERSNALTVDWSGVLSVYNADNKLALNPSNDTIDYAYTDPTTQETFFGSVFVPDIITKNNPILNGIVLTQSVDNSGFHIHNTTWDTTIGEEVPTNISALGSYTIYDVNDYPAFYMQLEKTNADLLQQSFILQRDDGTGNNISHGFLLQINANGKPIVVFPSEESCNAWCNGLGVGTRQSVSLPTTTTKTVASGPSYTNVLSLTLPAGIWVVIAQLSMQYNSASASSYISLALGSTATGTQYAQTQVVSATSANTILQVQAILNHTESTTVYLNTRHNGGVTRTINGGATNTYIVAVRIASK